MSSYAKVRLSFIIVLALGLAACSQMSNQHPAISHDGLHRVEDTKLAAVYRDPDADFSQYRMVKVEDCSVSFRKDWERNQNSSRLDYSSRTTREDITRIKQWLSSACTSHIKEAIGQDTRFTLVDDIDPAATTLIVRPAIIDLYVNAPDSMAAGIRHSYTTSAGEMTLNLELYDATTNAILARVIDRRKDPDRGYLQWTNSITNKADAERILRYWARLLKESLNQALAQ